MATLQKIRNHGVILLVVVGLAMLAFILGDALNSGSSWFGFLQRNAGSINGQKISLDEYEEAKDQLSVVYKIEYGMKNLDEEITNQIPDQVWYTMRNDILMREEAEKIGLTVTEEELRELCLSENAHMLIRQRRPFCDENGQFNPEIAKEFHKTCYASEGQGEQFEQAKKYWLFWENQVRMVRLNEKYTALLQSMLTANNIDAKYQFIANQSSVDAQYVMQPYTSIDDATIEVSKKDLERIYDQRKAFYKQEPNRSFEYITFDIVPSEKDFADAEQLLQANVEEFTTAENTSAIVHELSSNKYNNFDYSINTIPADYKDFAFGPEAKKDAFKEITLAGNTYSMARLLDCGYAMSDSICLRAVGDSTEAPESYWFTEERLFNQLTQISPLFTLDAVKQAFNAQQDEVFTLTAGTNELKLRCEAKSPATPKVQIAIVEYEVKASSTTTTDIYNKAQQFIIDNTTAEAFRAAAQKEGYMIHPANVKRNQLYLNSFKDGRKLIKWVFDAEVGQINQDMYEGDNQYIVALVTSISDDEYKSMEEVGNELRFYAMRDAKAEQIMAKLSSAKNLQDAATIAGTPIDTAVSVQLSGRTFDDYYEPAAVGAAFATKAGQLSAPVKGEQGVFIMVPGQTLLAEGEQNDAAMIEQMNMTIAQPVMYQLMDALVDHAKIKDNRYKFY